GVPPAVEGVEEGELGARVGAFSPADQPCPFGPGVEGDEGGQLGDLGTVAVPAVPVDGGHPSLVVEAAQGALNGGGDLVADGEAQVVPQVGQECVGGAGAVRADQDRVGDLFGVVAGLVADLVGGGQGVHG